MTAAHAEYGSLLRVEHSRRHDTLVKRLTIAGRLMEDRLLSKPMDLLLSRSEFIDEVRRAEIPHQVLLIFDGPGPA